VEELELLYITDGDTKWNSHFRKHLSCSLWY
jgi:hypothetical protein